MKATECPVLCFLKRVDRQLLDRLKAHRVVGSLYGRVEQLIVWRSIAGVKERYKGVNI